MKAIKKTYDKYKELDRLGQENLRKMLDWHLEIPLFNPAYPLRIISDFNKKQSDSGRVGDMNERIFFNKITHTLKELNDNIDENGDKWIIMHSFVDSFKNQCVNPQPSMPDFVVFYQNVIISIDSKTSANKEPLEKALKQGNSLEEMIGYLTSSQIKVIKAAYAPKEPGRPVKRNDDLFLLSSEQISNPEAFKELILEIAENYKNDDRSHLDDFKYFLFWLGQKTDRSFSNRLDQNSSSQILNNIQDSIAQKKLVLTGPAGSGKTVLFFKKLENILHEELSYDQGKEFTFTHVNTCLYHKAVDILQIICAQLSDNNKKQVYDAIRKKIRTSALGPAEIKSLNARVNKLVLNENNLSDTMIKDEVYEIEKKLSDGSGSLYFSRKPLPKIYFYLEPIDEFDVSIKKVIVFVGRKKEESFMLLEGESGQVKNQTNGNRYLNFFIYGLFQIQTYLKKIFAKENINSVDELKSIFEIRTLTKFDKKFLERIKNLVVAIFTLGKVAEEPTLEPDVSITRQLSNEEKSLMDKLVTKLDDFHPLRQSS